MIPGMWGRKIGMAQLFANDKVIPVTAIDVAHWLVTNIRTKERDGYNAVQIGCPRKRYVGQDFSFDWLKNLKKYFTFVREIRLEDIPEGVVVGKPADFYAAWAEGDKVDIFGITRGRGFAGVIKRHNFGGPPASHGHTMGKKPGSIGCNASQGKVRKGKKMPGHMGAVQRATKNVDLVKIEKDARVVFVKGAVPGHAGSLVFLRKA